MMKTPRERYLVNNELVISKDRYFYKIQITKTGIKYTPTALYQYFDLYEPEHGEVTELTEQEFELELAKRFAEVAHKNQVRKGKTIPFITHLESAVAIAQEITNDSNILAATWLHDTVEDTHVTLDDIKEIFNNEIYKYTVLETEKKDSTPTASWKIRKELQLAELSEHKNDPVIIITFADKFANLQEILEDYRELGDKVFERFNNKDKSAHQWYYTSFLKIFEESKQIPSEYTEKFRLVLAEIFE